MHRLILRAIATSMMMVCLAAVAQSRYDNPLDNKTYETSGEFKTYQPASPKDTRGQRVTTAGVTLLTGEPELKSRVKVEELAAFIKEAEVRAYSELEKNKSPMSALVQFNCQPGKCQIKLASQGQAEKSTLQAIYDSLSKMVPLNATGEVIFQVEFRVGA